MTRSPFEELADDDGFDLFGNAPAPEPQVTRPLAAEPKPEPQAPTPRPDAHGGLDWELPGETLESVRRPSISPDPAEVAAPLEGGRRSGGGSDRAPWTVVDEAGDADEAVPAVAEQEFGRTQQAGDCVGAGYLLLRRRAGDAEPGTSFQALDLERREEVVVRFHPPGPRPQLLHEMQCFARLRHPSMPRVLDLGVADGAAFVVFAPRDGLSLSELAKVGGGCAPHVVLRMVCQLVHAFEEAGRRGVSIRRLTPDRVLVTPDGMPRLVDPLVVTPDPGYDCPGSGGHAELAALARVALGQQLSGASEVPPVGFEGTVGSAQVLDAVERAAAAPSPGAARQILEDAARQYGLDPSAWRVPVDRDPLGAPIMAGAADEASTGSYPSAGPSSAGSP